MEIQLKSIVNGLQMEVSLKSRQVLLSGLVASPDHMSAVGC